LVVFRVQARHHPPCRVCRCGHVMVARPSVRTISRATTSSGAAPNMSRDRRGHAGFTRLSAREWNLPPLAACPTATCLVFSRTWGTSRPSVSGSCNGTPTWTVVRAPTHSLQPTVCPHNGPGAQRAPRDTGGWPRALRIRVREPLASPVQSESFVPVSIGCGRRMRILYGGYRRRRWGAASATASPARTVRRTAWGPVTTRCPGSTPASTSE